MKKQKNYDKKVKNTRIVLADWLLLKSIAQNAGVSMSQALHKLITGQDHKDKAPAPEPAQMPLRAIPTTVYRSGSTTVLATNGNKAVAFRIKTKGARYD